MWTYMHPHINASCSARLTSTSSQSAFCANRPGAVVTWTLPFSCLSGAGSNMTMMWVAVNVRLMRNKIPLKDPSSTKEEDLGRRRVGEDGNPSPYCTRCHLAEQWSAHQQWIDLGWGGGGGGNHIKCHHNKPSGTSAAWLAQEGTARLI